MKDFHALQISLLVFFKTLKSWLVNDSTTSSLAVTIGTYLICRPTSTYLLSSLTAPINHAPWPPLVISGNCYKYQLTVSSKVKYCCWLQCPSRNSLVPAGPFITVILLLASGMVASLRVSYSSRVFCVMTEVKLFFSA